MEQAVLFMLISVPLCGSSTFDVRQPRRVSSPMDSSAMLECSLEGEVLLDYSVHWMKQIPGAAPNHILSQENDSSIRWSDTYSKRFQPIRNSHKTNYLQITQVATNDSAIYWCVVVTKSYYPVWGGGTKLSVFGGQDVMAPSVTLLSGRDSLNNSSILLVLCLVSNFYPPVIEVTWKLEGQVKSRESTSMPSFSAGDNSFSLASVLELPVPPELTFSSVSCEVRHDSSRTLISKNIHNCYSNTLD
ncbi:immunoglobulin lambda-1 light chain-like [Pelobates fuscus]|uniref:immunoglobulin lambda-1 light chain-like n=1 Tax=Pelobates fuscus TaxID=191477 RepID=UPI002FE4B229